MNRFALLSVASAAIFCVMAPDASAQLISQSHSFTNQTLNINNFSTANFNKFDTSLGTLTQVRVIYDVEVVSGSLIVDNDGGVQLTTNYSAQLIGSVNDADLDVIMSLLTIGDTLNDSVTLDAENGDGPGVIDSNGPDGTAIGLTALADNSIYTVTSGVQFESFKTSSAEVFDLEFSASRDFNIEAGAAEGGFTTTSASGSIVVEYTYTPIPEPASAALIGLSAIGFMLRRRRL